MALTFPLEIDQFADIIIPLAQSIDFHLEERTEASGIGTGNIIVASTGPAFWVADVTLRPVPNRLARQILALISAMDGGIGDFYFYDPINAYPPYDPDGTSVDGATVTISAVNANSKEIKLAGLPPRFEIDASTMISFPYGPLAEYTGLHSVITGQTADGTGAITEWIEIRPFLDDPDLETGIEVSLIKPACRMKIVPGSFTAGRTQDIYTSGIGFRCEQVP